MKSTCTHYKATDKDEDSTFRFASTMSPAQKELFLKHDVMSHLRESYQMPLCINCDDTPRVSVFEAESMPKPVTCTHSHCPVACEQKPGRDNRPCNREPALSAQAVPCIWTFDYAFTLIFAQYEDSYTILKISSTSPCKKVYLDASPHRCANGEHIPHSIPHHDQVSQECAIPYNISGKLRGFSMPAILRLMRMQRGRPPRLSVHRCQTNMSDMNAQISLTLQFLLFPVSLLQYLLWASEARNVRRCPSYC